MSSPLVHHPRFDHLVDALANNFDINAKVRVYHVSTPPVPTAPIYASPPGQADQVTSCESHFLTISQAHVTRADAAKLDSDLPPANRPVSGSNADHVLIMGIEVLIFSTEDSTTVFVSKADSTGFLERRTSTTTIDQGSTSSPSSPAPSPSLIRTVISTLLKWLLSWHLSLPTLGSAESDLANEYSGNSGSGSGPVPHEIAHRNRPKRLILSLFARSQNQYLFPGSIENKAKHVLDDRQLIKWWCRLLDELVQKQDWHIAPRDVAKLTLSQNGDQTLIATPIEVNPPAKAYVVVPGCDRSDTIRSFFPPSARYARPGAGEALWHNSYPVNSLTANADQSGLTAEKKISLPVRCLIPRLPDDPKARYCDDLDHAGIDSNGQWRDIRTLQQFWETMEYRQECAAGRLVGFVWIVFNTGYDLQKGSNEASLSLRAGTMTGKLGTSGVSTKVDEPPSTTQNASVVLTSEQYITLSDLLIDDTDFAGAELAVKSTQQWIDKVKELSGLQSFGIDVSGRKQDQPAAVSSSTDACRQEALRSAAGVKHPRDEAVGAVNVLTAVRKKKKHEFQASSLVEANGNASSKPQNENGSDARESKQQGTTKEKESEAQTAKHSAGANEVMTLSAGLVRKKPKPKSVVDDGFHLV